MGKLYDWIRSLVSYMVLMTMLINLLPDHKYEKYLRLFTGMVFLLLVISPFTDITGTAAHLTAAFERITFQAEVKLLEQEIAHVDEARMEQLELAYRLAAEQNMENGIGEEYEVEQGNTAVISEAE